MHRRSFLKALGAIAAGVGLRTVPVLGQTYSELVVPKAYAVAVPAPSMWGIPVSAAEITAMWAPATERMFADDSVLRGIIQNHPAVVYCPDAFTRIVGL